MSYFSKLKVSLGKSVSNLAWPGRNPDHDLSPVAASFDRLRLKNLHRAPDRLPALFRSRERSLGDPALLFAGKAKVKGKTPDLKQAKLQWLDVLDSLKPYGLRGQIAGINSYLNQSGHAPALARLGQKSRLNKLWTAPLRVFHNAGSEHIAFAKYLSLRHMGV
ncbi:MAG TPA: hypothetical protein ENI69_04815, partial [Rhodospirillales bacterium]|nr:hypothetical protein [Rhodospirillales bacterium]